MKKRLVKLLLLILLFSVSLNTAYSYSILGKIVKPKSSDKNNDNGESTIEDTVSETGQRRKQVTNSAGSMVLDSSHNSTGQNNRERFIILHYTALNREKSLLALTKNDVSSHFLVTDDRKDPVFALVPENKRAWHAGESEWKNSKNLNDSSLGIEIVNDGDSSGFFLPYKDFQIKNVAVLIKYLAEKYDIPPENILGHSDIAPQRKSDPGPMFPWEELHKKYNIGMWYDESRKKAYEYEYSVKLDEIPIEEIQKEFKKFGYNIGITGKWDKETRNVVRVFQHHFRPDNYEGKVDLETFAILKALNEKYNKK